MATILNDRDEILQAASPRLNVVSTDYISFTASDPSFKVDGTTATPSAIVISFILNGRLEGTPVITTSGVSSVTTTVVSSVLTQVSVAYANITAETVSVTATLNYAGNTYTSTASISGSATAPAQVASGVTVVPEGLLLRITWPKNTEIDVTGYEVRTSDANWGTDSTYLFRGNSTSCAVSISAPTAAGSVKTYYIKAYDSTNLFSTAARSVSYTIAAPSAPTGLATEFSAVSATSSTISLTWNPTLPAFGLKYYTVKITYPDTTTTDIFSVTSANAFRDISWSGTGKFQVSVTDILGNASAYATAVDIVKTSPGDIASITASPVGMKLLLNWPQATKGSLPITGYEVRSTTNNWGTAGYLYRGSVSECQVAVGALDVVSNFYVKSIDASGIYSTNYASTSYTRTKPNEVTGVTYTFSTTTQGIANVTFKWVPPASQPFAVKLYRLTLTKPGNIVASIDIYSDSWTTVADWEGQATLVIKTVDVFDIASVNGVTTQAVKVPVNLTNASTSIVNVDNTVVITVTPPANNERAGLTWTRSATTATITDTAHGYITNTIINITASSSTLAIPVGTYTITVVNADTYTITCLNGGTASGTVTNSTNSSLDIAKYELKNSANTSVIYLGSSAKIVLQSNNFALGSNTWNLRAIDSAGKYSSNSKSITYTTTAPDVATNLSSTISDSNSGVMEKFTWGTPDITATGFAVQKYRIKLQRPNKTDINDVVAGNSWTISPSWSGNATLSIYTIDVVGYESATAATLTATIDPPAQPGTVTSNFKGKSLNLSWAPVARVAKGLAIAGYEIRDIDANWGTTDTSLLWRGTATSASLDATGLLAQAEAYDYYLKVFDTELTYNTTVRLKNITITAPASILNTSISASYSTAATGNTVLISWPVPSTTFDIDYYTVTLVRTGKTDLVVKTYATSYTFDVDWTDDASVSVTATDVIANSSTASVKTLTKQAPGAPVPGIPIVTGTGITLVWTPGTTGSLPIAGYEVRSSASGPGTAGYLWKGTASSLDISALSLGANNCYIWAYDTDNKYSATYGTLTYTAVRPSDPTFAAGTDWRTFNTSLTSATIIVKWIKPATSVFGISRYEATFVTTTPSRTLTTTRNTNDWEIPADWTGTATLNVTAYDTLGLASNTVSNTVAKLLPSTPGTITNTAVIDTAIELDWPDTTKTTLPVLGYEIWRGPDGTAAYNSELISWGASSGYLWKGTSSNNLIDLRSLNTSAGDILNFYVKAYDTDNKYSSTAQKFQYTVAAPVNTTNVTGRFEDTNLTAAIAVINWDDTSPVFGLKHYEVAGSITLSTTTTAGSSTVTLSSTKGINKGDFIGNNANIPQILDGNILRDRKVTQVLASTNQIVLESGSGILAGTATSKITRYVNTNSSELTIAADWPPGDKTIIIRTVDNLNHKSSGATALTLTKANPGIAFNFRAQVIDNTVLLYWTLPALTTLPISHVRLKRGTATATWATATDIGNKDGTFTTVTELQGGAYSYWIAVVDTDNNESSPVSLATTVSAPPDYIFNAEYVSTFSGTLVNALKEANTGNLVMPVNTTETFEAHFTAPGWAGPSAQVSAGYPLYIQPGLSSGYYEEVFNYGQVLGASQVSVAITGTAVSGNITPTITISTSTDGITYPTTFTSTSAFATNFRYIKVRVAITQVTAGNIYSLSSLVVRLDAKQKTDSGTAIITLGGAHAQGNLSYDYYTSWISGMSMATPPTGFGLNGTVAENSIISSNGPSGLAEPVWACLDIDANTVGIEGDGGWGTAYSTIDSTKGHLFAVFMKTTTNNGTSYWGTNLNGTIGTLAGVVESNPYFWVGDLPALDTWYLVVGYVYPIGYGTTDGGISGVYNLSGTKVASGTSFKLLSGSSLMHRSYHFYNATSSGTVVQQMARPIIMQCDAGTALSKISYILQCATNYGVAVTPSNPFIDIISITATPQGSTVTTPIIDFDDIPSPKRFNIFNYTSAGALVSGTVSWAARGY